MKTVSVLAAAFLALGLTACMATPETKQAAEFIKDCGKNPQKQECIDYKNDNLGGPND